MTDFEAAEERLNSKVSEAEAARSELEKKLAAEQEHKTNAKKSLPLPPPRWI